MTTHCPHCGGQIAATPRPLTKRQAEMVRLIGASVANRGCAPSFEELAAALGYKSLATVHEHLTNIERKGWIRRSFNIPRGIELLHPLPVPQLGGAQ